MLIGWLCIGAFLVYIAPFPASNVLKSGDQPDYLTPKKMIILISFLVIATSVSTISVCDYFDFISILYIESILLTPRISSLLLGIVLGIIVKTNTRIQYWLKRLSFSAVGDAEHAPWVLQSGFALIFLIVLLAFIKPDLFNKFESIKAGEVEAKFGNVSPLSANALNTIDFGSADLFRNDVFDDWASFAPTYAPAKVGADDKCDTVYDDVLLDIANKGKGSVRQVVVQRFLSKEDLSLNKARLTTACIFFKYMTPVVSAVKCLRQAGELDVLRKNVYFSRMTYAEQRFVLNPAANKNALTQAFTDAIAMEEVIDSGCLEHSSYNKDSEKDADRIYQIAKDHQERLDPYIVNFVGGALSFSADTEAEAEFLNTTIRRYETRHPGLVSLYYALSANKLRSVADWPLEEILNDLERGYDANNLIIEKARRHEGDIHDDIAIKILSEYDANQTAFLSQFLQTFNQMSLNGISLDQYQRSDWARSFEKLQAIVNTLEGERRPSLKDYPQPVFDKLTDQEWAAAKIDAADIFDFATNIALSTILLTQDSGKSDAQACAFSRYYLSIANEKIEDTANDFAPVIETTQPPHVKATILINTILAKEKESLPTGPGQRDEPLMKKTYISRLKAYLLSIRHRVDVSCD